MFVSLCVCVYTQLRNKHLPLLLSAGSNPGDNLWKPIGMVLNLREKMPKRLYIPLYQTLPSNAKVIDRRSDWGNPHKVGMPGVSDRATAVALYERDLLAGTLTGYKSDRPLTIEDAKRELCGLDLVCSGCKEDGLPCHGDVLLRYANA
jgi:hypothetical protein